MPRISIFVAIILSLICLSHCDKEPTDSDNKDTSRMWFPQE